MLLLQTPAARPAVSPGTFGQQENQQLSRYHGPCERPTGFASADSSILSCHLLVPVQLVPLRECQPWERVWPRCVRS